MTCIAGGSFKRGNPKLKVAGLLVTVEISTFYLDKKEVTNEDYQRCIKAGHCYRPFMLKFSKRYKKTAMPVTYVSWHDAWRYCRWQGKRLPTEAEWEFAAKKNARPEAPGCQQSHKRGCRPARPVSPGKAKPGAQGLRFMTGNVAEWVNEWFSPKAGKCMYGCGPNKQNKDPKGPCSGAFPCDKHKYRIVKGGHWRSRTRDVTYFSRRAVRPTTRNNKIGFRCASDVPQPKTVGPVVLLANQPVKAPTTEMSAPQYKLFNGSKEDRLVKKLCPKGGRSTSTCRDPQHYVTSNEKWPYFFKPYATNRGGAYVGVGADQNYTLMAWARSQMAWLMDYDPIIPLIHKLHQAFILPSPNAQAFLVYYSKAHAKKSIARLRRVYAKDVDLKYILRTYRRYRAKIERTFKKEFTYKNRVQRDNWLTNPSHYTYIRQMFRLKRIRMMPGDLLAKNSLRGVSEAAKKMGIVVRIVYLSNAEENWNYPTHYRRSFQIMPFDSKSVILRTLSDPHWGTKKYSYFHYNIHHALTYQHDLMLRKANRRGYYYVRAQNFAKLLRVHAPQGGVSTIDMPRNPPFAPRKKLNK